LKHNLRAFDKDEWNKDGHIDYERSHLNEPFVTKDLYTFFDEQFGDALVEFNEKNWSKHPDRLIGFSSLQEYKDCPENERRERAVKAYYAKNKGEVQEAEIQLGNHKDYTELVAELGQKEADKIHRAYLAGALENWKKENPNMAVFCAVAHFDEIKDGSPHLHVDFLPIAESSRGLARKVSLEGALSNIGFKREKKQGYYETPYKRWLRSYRQNQEEYAQDFLDSRRLGLTIEPSEPSKASHTQPQDYKLQEANKDMAAALSRQQDIEREIAAAQKEVEAEKEKLKAAKETNRTSMVNLLSNIEPKPTPPDKPRRAPWDEWVRGYHPKDSKGRELTGHKLKKELEEEKKRYDEYMQPWLEYDRLYAEWEQRYKPLEEVTKVVEQYTKGNRAVKERENKVSEREKAVSKKEKSLDSEVEQRAQALFEAREREMFGGVPTAREKRLEAFCDKVKYQDGSSVLDAFEEQEQALKRGKFKGR